MDRLSLLQRDVKMIKTAKRAYTAGRICSTASIVVVGIIILWDIIKTIK